MTDFAPSASEEELDAGPARRDPKFEALLDYLKESRGFDFTGYKRSSLMRRVNRQMQEAGVADYDDYRDLLELHPAEFVALFNTVLINVTAFFRDADAWTYLRESVVPALVERKGSGPIRIWSAGCATGEEAFSLAIALAEELGIERFRKQVKIYATDVDEDALSQARQASFTERELRNVPPDLLERYFEPTGTRFSFTKSLRRSVIFGRNDLLQDAPISHIDLLVCRNTLMYFNAETQSGIVRRLHFALDDDGMLFLGKAEMLLSHTAYFTPVDLKRRFFRKVVVVPGRERSALVTSIHNTSPTGPDDQLSRLRQEAMNANPVAQIVLDAESRTLLVNQRADTLLGLSGRDLGRPFQDLEISYRPVELRSHIELATLERRPVWVHDIEWTRGQSTVWLDVQIVPLTERDGALLGTSLLFSDVSRYRQLQGELEYANRQLETAYEELQSTVEELETTNEELQSTVEELETTNEELQSTNEELETMNEELQSMNDELQSSNDELRERTSQVSDLNGFLESVLTAMEAGVAVVDLDLRIHVWNGRAEELWGVRQEEAVGQHLLALDIGLPTDRLKPLLRQALAEEDGRSTSVELDAINRRGREIRVSVAVSPLSRTRKDSAGALLVMSTIG